MFLGREIMASGIAGKRGVDKGEMRRETLRSCVIWALTQRGMTRTDPWAVRWSASDYRRGACHEMSLRSCISGRTNRCARRKVMSAGSQSHSRGCGPKSSVFLSRMICLNLWSWRTGSMFSGRVRMQSISNQAKLPWKTSLT